MNKVFGVFVLVLVLVSTLGAGYALAQAAPESPDTGPSQEQYGTSGGATPPEPTTGSADPATDGPEGPPDAASASASASSNASATAAASASADPDGAYAPSPEAATDPPPAHEDLDGSASEGTAPSMALDDVAPDRESAASAESSSSSSVSASASASPSSLAEAMRPGAQVRSPAGDADSAGDEDAPLTAEGSAEYGPTEEGTEPEEGAAPAPSTEPPVAKDPFNGTNYRASDRYGAWRARPCGEDDCGLQDIPPEWECYSYKKTVWGDVTYACGVPRSPDNKHPRIHVYDEGGDLVYEGRGSDDWIDYMQQECGEDDCGAPKVPEGWSCREEHQKDAPNRETQKYIRCFHPLLEEQDSTHIPSKYCTYTYDLEGNLLSRYKCGPYSGETMGDGAGGDAHNADVGLETGDGGDTGGGSSDGDAPAALVQAFTTAGAGNDAPTSGPAAPQVSDTSAGWADGAVGFGGTAESDSPAPVEGGTGIASATGRLLWSAIQRFSSDATANSDSERAFGAGSGGGEGSRGGDPAEVGSPAVAALVEGRSSRTVVGVDEPVPSEHSGAALIAGHVGVAEAQGAQAEAGVEAAPKGEGGGARIERQDLGDDALAEGPPVDGDADRVASVARGWVNGLPWILSLGTGAALVGGLAVRRGLRPRP